MYLAFKEQNSVTTKKEVAEFFNISEAHLRKVVNLLASKEYIESFRGKGGGFRLSKKPGEIKIGDFLLDIGENLDVIDCHGIDCHFGSFCSLKVVLNKASRKFIDELNLYTLESLVSDKKFASNVIKLFK